MKNLLPQYVTEPLILRKLSSNRNRCEEDDVVAKTTVGTIIVSDKIYFTIDVDWHKLEFLILLKAQVLLQLWNYGLTDDVGVCEDSYNL